MEILDSDPHWAKISVPDPHWNQCRSTTPVTTTSDPENSHVLGIPNQSFTVKWKPLNEKEIVLMDLCFSALGRICQVEATKKFVQSFNIYRTRYLIWYFFLVIWNYPFKYALDCLGAEVVGKGMVKGAVKAGGLAEKITLFSSANRLSCLNSPIIQYLSISLIPSLSLSHQLCLKEQFKNWFVTEVETYSQLHNYCILMF